MRCQATRARRAPPAAMPMSPSPIVPASCSPRSVNSCPNNRSAHRPSHCRVMHSPPRILIVDDNETNRDILITRLGQHGYDLKQAADGEEALAAVKEHLPDLILLDVMMPKLDGIEVCKRLKGDASLPFMPIILRSEEHTSELQSQSNLVCRLLLEKKN